MTEYRKPTPAEIEALTAAGNSAENWDAIEVAQDFTPAQLSGCRLEGRVQIGRGARLRRCTIRNYRIGEEALIEGVTALECRRESSFGNGVRVAAINENGGRTVRIYDQLTAQTAYILAVYRYRPEAVEAIERMIERYATERRDTLGTVGPHARITGARFIREVNIGEGATIDGASLLENGTVCAGAYVGIDVQARDFIAAEGARIDGGTLLERCFAGECCTLDKHFTAVDSLFFANSHCENGEAVSIFAGPYTISHHKSSQLIAGMFSFLNAGSGEFGFVDTWRGRFEPIAFCPGFLRGASFIGRYAVVGISKPRKNKTFSGLALDRNLEAKGASARCAVQVIDLERGDVVHELRIEGMVDELFDTAIIAGARNPAMVGFVSDEIRRTLSLPPDAR